jgi:hypothetical protein
MAGSEAARPKKVELQRSNLVPQASYEIAVPAFGDASGYLRFVEVAALHSPFWLHQGKSVFARIRI